MINDLNDNHHSKPNLAVKGSKSSPLAHKTDNPFDKFSNSDDQTKNISNRSGIISPSPFYTERSTRLNEMARFNFLPKRKQSLYHKKNHITSTPHQSTVQDPTLPNCSNVTTNPNDYPIDNTSVDKDNESRVKISSKTSYLFPPPSL